MANEIKRLYKKNPKLALQVARVLGYQVQLVAQQSASQYETCLKEVQRTLAQLNRLNKHMKMLEQVSDADEIRRAKQRMKGLEEFLIDVEEQLSATLGE